MNPATRPECIPRPPLPYIPPAPVVAVHDPYTLPASPRWSTAWEGFEYDPASLQRNGSRVSLWTRQRFSTPQPNPVAGREPFDERIVSRDIDCQARTVNNLVVILSRRATEVFRENYFTPDPLTIQPTSPLAGFLPTVCTDPAR